MISYRKFLCSVGKHEYMPKVYPTRNPSYLVLSDDNFKKVLECWHCGKVKQ